MFALARALTYATLFIGVVLLFVPAQILTWSGINRPEAPGPVEWTGVVIGALGAGLAVWCILAFAVLGRGTPAPFDPPRHLVVRGPYRYVRNPMYVGAGTALAGAALFYRSPWLLGYVVLFAAITHAFVVRYEEPTLRRLFGQEYETYCRAMRRWWPG